MLVNMFNNHEIFFSGFHLASFHDPVNHFYGFVKLKFIGTVAAPRKSGNMFWRKARHKDIGKGAANGTGIKLCVNGRFGMVAHD